MRFFFAVRNQELKGAADLNKRLKIFLSRFPCAPSVPPLKTSEREKKLDRQEYINLPSTALSLVLGHFKDCVTIQNWNL